MIPVSVSMYHVLALLIIFHNCKFDCSPYYGHQMLTFIVTLDRVASRVTMSSLRTEAHRSVLRDCLARRMIGRTRTLAVR